MKSRLVDYRLLLEQFLSGVSSAMEFQTTYLDCFKNEGLLDERLFEILDELFGDIDSFSTDPELLAENPEFYIDEARLREKAQFAVRRLETLKDQWGP